MIDIVFLEPFYFILIFIALAYLVYLKNSKSLNWIYQNISKRFTNKFTIYNSINKLLIHLFVLLSLAVLLLFSAANPYIQSEVETVDSSGKILFIIDGSFSMLASDTTKNPITKKFPYDRLAEATEFAERVIDLLPEYEYGLISFSGESVIHSAPTKDIITIKTMVHTLLAHNFDYTGTSFKKALHQALRLSYELEGSLQIVLLSDGEVPKDHEENIDEELEFLSRNHVPIHTIGVGTKNKGGKVDFFISYTEEEKKKLLEENLKNDSTGTKKVEVDKKIIKTIDTHREDALLKRIAAETGGKYLVVEENDSPDDLVEELIKKQKLAQSKRKAQGKKSLVPIFLAIFLVAFLLERFLLYRK